MLECTYNVSILPDDVHTPSVVLHLPLLKIIDSGRKTGIVAQFHIYRLVHGNGIPVGIPWETTHEMGQA